MITALDLSLLVLCDTTYPKVLAFSFLSDLQREFLVFYDRQKIFSVQRPYALIDFGRRCSMSFFFCGSFVYVDHYL